MVTSALYNMIADFTYTRPHTSDVSDILMTQTVIRQVMSL